MTLHRTLALLALTSMLSACVSINPDDSGLDEDSGNSDTDVTSPGDFAESELTRNLSPGVSDADVRALTTSNRDFAFAFYAKVSDTPGNLFLSPHSISTALAMTYAGAEGTSETQIADALSFDLPEVELHPAFNQLDLDLESRAELPDDYEGDGFELSVVNATWGQQGYPLKSSYLDTLAVNYGAGVHLMDFGADPDGSREVINDWVEEQTNDRILDLLPAGSITGDTKLVLTNAIYFKASWGTPFEVSNTTDDAFTTQSGSSVTVPTMHGSLETLYADADGYEIAELPYLGDQLSMTLIVPDAGNFDTIEAGLDRAFFDAATSGLNSYELTLALPKFQFRSNIDAATPLKALGMTAPFSSGEADFSGITDESRLYISSVIHQAFVDVNEEGTEAAAATAVVFADTSVPEQATLTVDRPFLFAIRDRVSGAVLFLGRVSDPS